MIYQYLANDVLILNVAIVLFIIFGPVLTLAGDTLAWSR